MKVIGTWRRSRAALVAALALATVLPGCDGGNDTPTTPAFRQPDALVRALLVEGNFNLIGLGDASREGFLVDYIRHEFTTSGTGFVEVNADWTFANSQMGIVVGLGACSFAQIDAALAGNTAACPEAVGRLATSKPARVTTNILPQGTYTLVILNRNDHTESGNYQVYQVSLPR
jgi:hypothetical protein